MTLRRTLRRILLLATVLVASAAAGAALAHNNGHSDETSGLHQDLPTTGEERVLVDAKALDGSSYRLIERQTAAGTCLKLELAGGSVPHEGEACGLEGLPTLKLDDAQDEQQYVFGLTAADTQLVEVDTGSAKAAQAPVEALSGRARAFALRVPGAARERSIEVRESTGGGRPSKSQSLRFAGPERRRFETASQRDAEFDFHAHSH